MNFSDLKSFHSLAAALATGLSVLFTGCTISPEAAKLSATIAAQNSKIGDAYVSDLNRLADLEQTRIDALNDLAEEVRRRSNTRIEAEFSARKAAAIAEIRADFDHAALNLLAQEFWTAYLARTPSRDAITQLELIDAASASVAESVSKTSDKEAIRKAILSLRSLNLNETAGAQAMHRAFAKAHEAVLTSRRKLEREIEAAFASKKANLISPSAKLATEKAELEKSITRALRERADYMSEVNAKLDEAHQSLTTYLVTEDKERLSSFVSGVVGALVVPHDGGVGTVIETTQQALVSKFGEDADVSAEVNKAAKEVKDQIPGILDALRVALSQTAQP
jgi:hypothetical protein